MTAPVATAAARARGLTVDTLVLTAEGVFRVAGVACLQAGRQLTRSVETLEAIAAQPLIVARQIQQVAATHATDARVRIAAIARSLALRSGSNAALWRAFSTARSDILATAVATLVVVRIAGR